jgi:ribosomal protein S6--L-glutamate ligase
MMSSITFGFLRLRFVKNSIFVIILLLTFSYSSFSQLLKEKILIGRVEWIEIPSLKVKLRARIDTGAKTTSMHAVNITEVQQQDDLFVRFQTVDSEGKLIDLLKKVDTTQKVANTAGFITKRYVIREKIKMGSMEKEILVNLNDRTEMEYKFLVGRNLLLGRFIVDVARSHVLGDN